MENKNKKIAPEVDVAKRYYDITTEAEKLKKTKDETPAYTYNKKMLELRAKGRTVQFEAIERFVRPYLKNHSFKNMEENFDNWYLGWHDQFDNLNLAQRIDLEVQQSEYNKADQNGKTPLYEEIKLEDHYKRPFLDMKFSQWMKHDEKLGIKNVSNLKDESGK
jgi:hypothetical protein